MSSPAASTNKTRSPNYPVISLEDALSKLRLIYEKHQRYPASRETLVQLMGYSGLSGTSAPVVSALAKYGLIEGYGETRRVSELGQDLMLHQKGDLEYTKALRTAASQPAFFQDLREAFPSGLPSDHSLRAALVKRGFNPKAIEGAVRAYRETLEFVESEAGEEKTEALDESSAEGVLKGAGASDPSRSSDPPRSKVAGAGLDPTQRSITLPLLGSAWATLQGPFPVSADAWEQMMNVLQAMRPALVTSHLPSASPQPSPIGVAGDEVEAAISLDE